MAKKGAIAGELPRRTFGPLALEIEPLRERVSKATFVPCMGELLEVWVRGFIFRERLLKDRKRGEGGREDPGVSRGETGRDPGRDCNWNPRGDAGAVEGGESLVGTGAWRFDMERGLMVIGWFVMVAGSY